MWGLTSYMGESVKKAYTCSTVVCLVGVLVLGPQMHWVDVVRIPFSQPPQWQMLRFFDAQTRIANEHFVTRWKAAGPQAASPHVIVIEGGEDVPEGVDCFKTRKCLIHWKNIVSPEQVTNMSQVTADMFVDEPYSFQNIGGTVSANDSEKVTRSFTTLNLHEGMAQMRAGANIQLGFDVKLSEKNLWLKNIGLELLEKISEFNADVMYLAQNFMYFGNQQQANLHNDPLSGFSFQLTNSKLWRFVSPEHTHLVRPFRGDNPGVFYCDLCFVENSTVPFVEILVGPGDMIFFPEHWWHEVHPIEDDGFGITVAYRELDLGKLVGPSAFFSSRPVFFHKMAALLDMTVNKRAAEAPENL